MVESLQALAKTKINQIFTASINNGDMDQLAHVLSMLVFDLSDNVKLDLNRSVDQVSIFHRHFTRSLNVHRWQKRKKYSRTFSFFLRFWDLHTLKALLQTLVKLTPDARVHGHSQGS